jgi:DNA transposition AAA+ family ATPase
MTAQPAIEEYRENQELKHGKTVFIHEYAQRLQRVVNGGVSWKYISNYTKLSVPLLQEFVGGNISAGRDLYEIVKAVESFLKHREFYGSPLNETEIVRTKIFKEIVAVCAYAREDKSIVIIDGPAGSGKSMAVHGLKQQYPVDVLIVSDVVTKSPVSILPLIGRQVPLDALKGSISQQLHRIIDKMYNSQRLIIVDEAHFLSWESLEVLRRINDAAQIGIVLCGQERLYLEMKRQKGPFLWDQISSRLGIRHTVPVPDREDTDMLCRHLCPTLDDKSLDYMYQIARSSGRFRAMTRVLLQAQKITERENVPITAHLLHEIAGYHLL